MLLLVGCGDAASTGEGGEGEQPPVAAESSANPPSTAASPSPASSSAPAPAPAPAPTSEPEPAPAPAPVPAPADCSSRTGGALVTFAKGNETWSVWITNPKFNTEAFLAAAKGSYVTPVFNQVVDGVDCDGQFTWHVDGDDVQFEADYDASCDALPSTVEANKGKWLVSKRWCPSKVLVSSYQGQ